MTVGWSIIGPFSIISSSNKDKKGLRRKNIIMLTSNKGSGSITQETEFWLSKFQVIFVVCFVFLQENIISFLYSANWNETQWKKHLSLASEDAEWWIPVGISGINCCSEWFLSNECICCVCTCSLFKGVLQNHIFLVTRGQSLSVCRLKFLIICPLRHFHNKLDRYVSSFNYS